ncbi:methyltransferase domain-containing protein [Paenibacillus filicis]|uniref:Methyltransferase domain-containing protein n=1 Tax=Paenibacillus filicis TaxID=669464 RepID=A0ABU9DKQ0_9BACL
MDERRSSYHFQQVSIGEEAELLRLKEQALMGWDKEHRTLRSFGLKDGMKVLEAGSGPGFITEQLVKGLPNGSVTALEIDEVLLGKARQMLSDVPASRLTFIQGSVYRTELPDDTYDFVIARLLFLHLIDPVEAAIELRRVLKPGGKLVIIDVDDAIFGAIHPDIDVLPSILKKLAALKASKGGSRHIGRSLPRLLSGSGFTDVDMEAVIQHSDLHGIEGFRRVLDVGQFAGFYRSGIISPEEYEALHRSYDQFVQAPDAHAMLVFLMACGTKPQGACAD